MRDTKAFPYQFNSGVFNEGMTLRDFFAAKCMQALLAHSWKYDDHMTKEKMAEMAWRNADALLAAREKT